MLTTQRQGDAEVVKGKSIFIDFLPDNYPERLFCSLAGDLSIDQDIATEICDLVGRMTLAIYLIGRALALKHLRTADFLVSLREDPVEVLSSGPTHRQNISRFLDGCIKPLSVESWQVLSLRVASTHGWFGHKTIYSCVRLNELVDFGWVVTGEQSCQMRHILLHNFLASKMENVEPEWISRLGTYYLKHLEKIGTQTKSESFSL